MTIRKQLIHAKCMLSFLILMIPVTHDITVTIYMANAILQTKLLETDRSDQKGDLLTGDSKYGG